MVPYLMNRILPRFPRLSAHLARELRTNCEAIDLLMEGKPAHVADLLMQRVKAIESNLQGKNWEVAGQQELVENREGLTSINEQLLMARQELKELKLREASKKTAKGIGGGDG